MASKAIYDDLVKRVQQIFHMPPNETKSLQNQSNNFYHNNPFDGNSQQQKLFENNQSELDNKYQAYATSFDAHLNSSNASETLMTNQYNEDYAINQTSDYGNQSQSLINQNQSTVRDKLSNDMAESDMSMKSIKVTVGIDEDLKMILEMDPSIVDLGGRPTVDDRKFFGLPPITGG